ncbi:MAG TPA: trehalose-phosphatase [Terricaulis sp.]|nr:trehalose-phosphatase [Terricaulis sp.]
MFFDLDGTLAEIADTPEAVRLDARMRSLLVDIVRAGACAVLTGRAVAEADRILEGVVPAIAGLHGLESRMAPSTWLRQEARADAVRIIAARFEREIATGQLDARLEDKGASIALHYRHAPHAETRIREAAERAARAAGLKTLSGKCVIEIIPHGADKGHALRAFMHAAPFVGRRPVAVGDDVTDESAFEAANALGGYSVLVGPARRSAAQFRLGSVGDVRVWLTKALEGTR